MRPRLDRALTAARRPGDAVAIVLALLVLAGIALRLWLMVLWRPAFLGFPDSAIYRHAPLWAAGAGVALGAMLCVRLAGAATVPALLLWLLVHGRGRARRLIPAAALLAGVLLVAGSYLVARHDATGDWAMTRSGGWNLYAAPRRSPTARSSRRLRHPPPVRVDPGVAAARPELLRARGVAGRPGVRRLRAVSAAQPKATDRLEAFARAAILHQPVAYAKSIARNLWRFAAPDAFSAQSGNSPSTLVEQLVDPTFYTNTAPVVLNEYGTAGSRHPAGIGHVLAYERHTRIQGLVIAVLALPALLGVVLARGPARARPDLYALVVLALVLEPVATVFYDARYAIPVNGPLAAAAAYGLRIGASRPARARGARPEPEPEPAAQPQWSRPPAPAAAWRACST